MPSSGMLRRVALVGTGVSEERSATIIKVTIISSGLRVLGTANVPSAPIIVTQMMEALRSSETSVIKRVTQRNTPFFILISVKPIILHSIGRLGSVADQ
jgi:hypothetical protein